MQEIPNTPKFPPLMIISFLSWVVAQCIAFGWIKHGPDQMTLSSAATVLAVGLSWAESHLRGKRAIAHAILNAPTTVTNNAATADTAKEPVPLVTPPVTSMV